MSLRALLTTILCVLLLGPPAVAVAPDTSADHRPPRPPVSVRVASFNVLGSNHTVRSHSWRPGRARAKIARRWLRNERVGIAGLQEAQVDQLRVLTRKRWRSFPDPRHARSTETAQSVIWRRSRWRMVEAHRFAIPFARGQQRLQPVVRLQHRRTGRQVWVVSVHMSAERGRRGAHERRVGRARLVRVVRHLERTHHPVVVTGDMNDHRRVFCALTGRTRLVAASGGSNGADGCRTPDWMHVDWIFGSRSISWEDFRFRDGVWLDAITDHVVPVVRATLGGRR